jgi:chromosome segregation ATPase
MKDLTEGLDNMVVKGLKNKIDVLTTENYDLQNTLTIKDKEINSLNEKISELNSALESGKGRITDLENQVADLSSKEKESANLKSEISNLTSKVEELTNKDEEITKSLSEKESKIGELSKSLEEKEKVIGEQKSQLDKVETELTALKPVEPTSYTSDDRLICPSCGAVGKDIKSEEDKSKVLGYIGHKPMHGKINVCKKCGEQF